MTAGPRVSIAPIGAVSCATTLWRDRGQLRVTAIAKATFGFVQGGAMRVVEPAPIVEAEIHRRNNPVRSVVATGDLAPYLPFGDVLLVGHAHAIGAPAEAVTVRLGIAREAVLLDKKLLVVGERGAAEVAPFQVMPLVYERAFGGPGSRENPLGVGAGSDSTQPNILDPAHPGRLAGFAPISRTWPARKGLLTPEQRKALDLPIMEIAEGFDWSYFQAAPPDQRIGSLHGDEWIVLEGMHPSLTRVITRLPGARAVARVYGPPAEDGLLVHLSADTLFIDADAERCSVTWRGSIAVASEADLARIGIAAALSLQGAPISWPAHLPAAEVTALLTLPDTTLTTVDLREEEPPQDGALPFGPAGTRAPPAPSSAGPALIPGAPWAPGAIAPPVPTITPWLEGTLDLSAHQEPPTVRAPAARDDLDAAPPPPDLLALLPRAPAEPPPELSGAAVEPPDLLRALPPQPPLLTPLAEPEEVALKPLPPEPVMVRQPILQLDATEARSEPETAPWESPGPLEAPWELPSPRQEAPAPAEPPGEPPTNVWGRMLPQQVAPAPGPPPAAKPSVKADLYKKFAKR